MGKWESGLTWMNDWRRAIVVVEMMVVKSRMICTENKTVNFEGMWSVYKEFARGILGNGNSFLICHTKHSIYRNGLVNECILNLAIIFLKNQLLQFSIQSNTQFFIKNLLIKVFKECLETIVKIFIINTFHFFHSKRLKHNEI